MATCGPFFLFPPLTAIFSGRTLKKAGAGMVYCTYGMNTIKRTGELRMDGRLTAQEMLKHARHDYMNALHLIRMQLDLGMEDSVRETIDSAVERGRRESMLGSLGMPLTESWLLTFGWRFPEYELELSVDIRQPGEPAADRQVERFLEELFDRLSDGLSPYAEYRADIRVETNENGWMVGFSLTGPFDLTDGLPERQEDTPFRFTHEAMEDGLELIVAGRKVDR